MARDLGAEKFLDIKCRMAGLSPDAVVLVATVRALKHHGGCPRADLNTPNVEYVRRGVANLARHIDNLKDQFGLSVCVAVNAFPTDTDEEVAVIRSLCDEKGVPCALSEVFAKGGAGGVELAKTVLSIMDARPIHYTYDLDQSLTDKVKAVAQKIYRADDVRFTPAAKKALDEILPWDTATCQSALPDHSTLSAMMPPSWLHRNTLP